jgi:hypothetical protein
MCFLTLIPSPIEAKDSTACDAWMQQVLTGRSNCRGTPLQLFRACLVRRIYAHARPKAPADPPGALLPAVSFFGGFRTPALVPVDRSVLAGIRNPSQKPPTGPALGCLISPGADLVELDGARPVTHFDGITVGVGATGSTSCCAPKRVARRSERPAGAARQVRASGRAGSDRTADTKKPRP